MLHLSCISGDAADIFDIGVSHAPQRADCLAASGSAVAVDKHGRILIIDEAGHLVKGLKRHILAAGDISFPVLFQRADIQQNSAGRGPDTLLHPD